MLLLDEVMAGLRGSEIEPALELIRSLRDEGMTIVAVEHIVKAILSVSDEVLVLHEGRELTRGKPDEVVNDERVIEAYLGQRYAKRMARRRAEPMLEVSGLDAGYGRVEVLEGRGPRRRETARSWPWSAPTAPGRPHCCAQSRA